MRDLQISVQHQRWIKGKDNIRIYQFKQGNRPKVLEEIPIYSGWSQSDFLNEFNL